MNTKEKRISKADARRSARSLVVRLMEAFEVSGGLIEEPDEVQAAFKQVGWMIIHPRYNVDCMPEKWNIGPE